MTEAPLVSAVVATYNYAHMLPRTLDSALAQDYPSDRLEIVVVDDGSTDDTPAVLADYCARYPGRVRAFRQPNAGCEAAVSRGFVEARGDFIAQLDADDLWHHDKVRRQVELFEARPEVGLVYSDLEVINGDDEVIHPSFWRFAAITPTNGPEALAHLLIRGNVGGASSLMFRATLKPFIGPLPSRAVYADWWTVTRAAVVSEIDYIAEPLVGYRMHEQNLTLGVQGKSLAREKVKQSIARRAGLIYGGAAALPATLLRDAWSAVERDIHHAMQVKGTVFVELPQTTPEEQTRAEQLSRRAGALATRGHDEQALRIALLAACEDPFQLEAHRLLSTIGTSTGPSLGDPLDGSRSYVLLATLDQLETEPAALTSYAATFDESDDVTLYVYAPGTSPEELEQRLTVLLEECRLQPDAIPDMVATPDPDNLRHAEMIHSAADEILGETTDRHLTGVRDRYESARVALTRPRALESTAVPAHAVPSR